jgi:hypothetical protein
VAPSAVPSVSPAFTPRVTAESSPSSPQATGERFAVGALGVGLIGFGAGLGLFIYFLPTIVGISRKMDSNGFLFFVNLFLGWSIIGWFVCLLWGATGQRKATAQ